jgi:hypothetical protein
MMIRPTWLAMFGVVGVVAAANVANADGRPTATADDFGFLWTRMDAGDGGAYAGQLVRFAPHASVTEHLYLGVEGDVGRFTANPVARAVARMTGGGEIYSGNVDGSFAAVKAVAGLAARAGRFTGAGELAAGVRQVELYMDGIEVGGVQDGAVVEGHGRLDMWLGSTVTLGAIAGVDLRMTRNVSAGLVLGFHFTR